MTVGLIFIVIAIVIVIIIILFLLEILTFGERYGGVDSKLAKSSNFDFLFKSSNTFNDIQQQQTIDFGIMQQEYNSYLDSNSNVSTATSTTSFIKCTELFLALRESGLNIEEFEREVYQKHSRHFVYICGPVFIEDGDSVLGKCVYKIKIDHSEYIHCFVFGYRNNYGNLENFHNIPFQNAKVSGFLQSYRLSIFNKKNFIDRFLFLNSLKLNKGNYLKQESNYIYDIVLKAHEQEYNDKLKDLPTYDFIQENNDILEDLPTNELNEENNDKLEDLPLPTYDLNEENLPIVAPNKSPFELFGEQEYSRPMRPRFINADVIKRALRLVKTEQDFVVVEAEVNRLCEDLTCYIKVIQHKIKEHDNNFTDEFNMNGIALDRFLKVEHSILKQECGLLNECVIELAHYEYALKNEVGEE